MGIGRLYGAHESIASWQVATSPKSLAQETAHCHSGDALAIHAPVSGLTAIPLQPQFATRWPNRPTCIQEHASRGLSEHHLDPGYAGARGGTRGLAGFQRTGGAVEVECRIKGFGNCVGHRNVGDVKSGFRCDAVGSIESELSD